MNKNRPVNLDLRTLKFPATAIASILHRISGIVLFLLLPVMLCFLGQSLYSAESYAELQTELAQPLYKLLLMGFLAALVYHLLAGIRHIIMDMGFGETIHAGRRTATATIGLAVILTLLLGIWIW